ncbi:hypothetical protein [Brevibacterium sp. UCMA 11754]|uniref:hypothetical protein n=1 Tax=Brevibacterium sp. UCMA 11754 TaxID=2749198 RepID=UPI001F43B098|nr:hypothetical protein [Brevibacterium sp. UCMA 11754]MCF2572058.1 hypothetical protein [Brevibacterium sp. UCMA 11754]
MTPRVESARRISAEIDRLDDSRICALVNAADLMHLFHWTLFELGFTSRSRRLELLRAAAADPAASVLKPVRAALGDKGADLIAEHASVAVRMTEMFAVLMQDAFGTRYDRR